MKERKHKYFDNPDWNVAFERCIDVLAELIEKYSDKVLNPAAIDINYNSIAITDYPIFLDEKIIIEDTWTGLIQEWLDHTSCDVVCIQQIYNEALKEMGKPRNSESREISLIMNGTISGWTPYPNPRNIPGYGKQRGWMRLETNSGNSDETFVSVEGTQMEIPFESQ